MIEKLWTKCVSISGFVYDGSLSIYELIIKTIEKVNDVIDETNVFTTLVNSFQSQINKKEDANHASNNFNTLLSNINTREKSEDITYKRKLSLKADFTGTIQGVKIAKIFSDIADSVIMYKDILVKIRDRESVGYIFDGGSFTNEIDYTTTIDGGVF